MRSKERGKKKGKWLLCGIWTHPKEQKTKSMSMLRVTQYGCVATALFPPPFLAFVNRGSLRSRADPLSLSCPLFIHLFPPFFIHSFHIPSLSFSAALNSPLSYEWLMNEVVLWSQESQRGWSSVKRCWTKDGREERVKGRKGGRREEQGYIQQGENVKEWTSIKSERDWGWMRVARKSERESRLWVFAWAPWGICIVDRNMQKGEHHASGK